jgi:thiol-disulfide isomerase/thioredoxin
VFVALLVLATLASASQRVMVIEDVTATWCTYCPGAARGCEELKFRAFDSVVVIAYHASSSDPFYTSTASARRAYYGNSGYPTVVLDGSNPIVGGLHTGTMYPTYRAYFDYRMTIPAPLEIDLGVTYDSVSRNGSLRIVVRNPGSSPQSGQLHTALTESHIYYPWQGVDSLHDVERTMLPSASGEAITVPAGDSVVRTRSFSINPSWVARNCEFVVFVQDNSTREMFQGACAAVMPRPALEFVGYQAALPAPGGDFDLTVGLRNIGSADALGASAVLSTTDPYVTVTTATANFGPIAVAEDGYALTPFGISVSSGCPDPHIASLRLIVTGSDLSTDTVDFPLNITATPGFFDNMEYGQHGWSHNGILDGWHLSTYRSVSPTHSWYCGNDGSHQYTNENDARLMTPFYTIGDSTRMHFQHWYTTEANYDYCLVEVGNGSLFWWPLAQYSGYSPNWQQASFNLAHFRGQTVQLRFRFISDYNGIDEGWYIDDFWSGALTGVAEREREFGLLLGTGRNPVRSSADLRYQLPSGSTGQVGVFDVDGRLVKWLVRGASSTGQAVWDLTDVHGREAVSGAYFVRLISDQGARAVKLVVAR